MFLQPDDGAVNIFVRHHGLLLSQLRERLASILLPPHRPAFDMIKVAIDPIRHEKIFRMTMKPIQHLVDGVLIRQLHSSDLLSDELSAHGERDLVIDVRLSHVAFGLQLVNFAIQKHEFAVHACEGPQALIPHPGEFRDGNLEGC